LFLNNLHRNTPELETTGKLQKQSHFIPWPLLTTHHDRHFLLTVKEKRGKYVAVAAMANQNNP